MEPPPKPSQHPLSPYIKMLLLPEIGHNRDMSFSSYPGVGSSEPGSLPEFQEEIHSSSKPLAIQLSISLFRWSSLLYGGNYSSRDTVGVSFLRAGLFFPEAKGSLIGLNAPLWVSQGHGGGSSNSSAWHHSQKYPTSPLHSQQSEGNVLRGFSSCWEIVGLRNVL